MLSLHSNKTEFRAREVLPDSCLNYFPANPPSRYNGTGNRELQMHCRQNLISVPLLLLLLSSSKQATYNVLAKGEECLASFSLLSPSHHAKIRKGRKRERKKKFCSLDWNSYRAKQNTKGNNPREIFGQEQKSSLSIFFQSSEIPFFYNSKDNTNHKAWKKKSFKAASKLVCGFFVACQFTFEYSESKTCLLPEETK